MALATARCWSRMHRLSMMRVGGVSAMRQVQLRLHTAATYASKCPKAQHSSRQVSHNSTSQSNLLSNLALNEPKRIPYWRNIPRWHDVEETDFMKYGWQVSADLEPAISNIQLSIIFQVRNIVQGKDKLLRFLQEVLPTKLPQSDTLDSELKHIHTRDDFLKDVEEGIKVASMAVRLTPHLLSVANWNDPLRDPIRRQFIPLKSTLVQDHPSLGLDSLHESQDSPVQGLVHRYPDKVLFLGKPQISSALRSISNKAKATSICPVYCRFCTRSYAVGESTDSVTKSSQKPSRRRWEAMFEYIENTPAVQDVVVSGGDSYYLHADHLRLIGERLLSMSNIKRVRFATKGLAVCPNRVIDPADDWTEALIAICENGRYVGKQVAIHTHFNHPNEITWITELAARHLFQRGVIVRNQTVLLRGVNDDIETMSTLIRQLADLNIQPYYVYQSDMVSGVEDLRTPLSTILELEKNIRGTIAGFMTPSFIVDLPGGGGKRLANSHEAYDPKTGVSIWKAPGVTAEKTYEYHDPIDIHVSAGTTAGDYRQT